MASLEAALDAEMKEVVAILEGKQKGQGRRADSPSVSQRAQSPGTAASPIRSMLDVDNSQRRSSSRGSTGIPFAMPSSPRNRVNPESAYKFDMQPSLDAHVLPKRVSQGPYKDTKPRAMSSVYGNSTGFLGGGPSRDRHNSATGPYGRSKSGSPGPHRSASPGARTLSPSIVPVSSNTLVTDSGKRIDGDTAYRKLSDSALARSGGGLSALPNRKGSDPAIGTTTAPGGGVRLTTDDDGDDSAAVESSDGESDSSDWDDGSAFATKKKERGRRRTRKESGGTDSMGREIITAKSLFTTAKEEGRFSASGSAVCKYLLILYRKRLVRLVQTTVTPRSELQRYWSQRRKDDQEEFVWCRPPAYQLRPGRLCVFDASAFGS